MLEENIKKSINIMSKIVANFEYDIFSSDVYNIQELKESTINYEE